jgi:hypothetical protein
LRACPIAGKYSTYPENKMRKIRETEMTFKEIFSEFMLVGWMQQLPDVVETEIECTLLRQEIDDTLFKISFINPISEKTKEKFERIALNHKDYYANNSYSDYRKYAEKGKEIWYYDAKIVFEYLILEFNKTDTTKSFWKGAIYFLLSAVYGLCPGIIRFYFNETFHGESKLERAGFYLNALSSTILMMLTIMFFVSAKFDMKRRHFILRQLGYMISCQKILRWPEPKLLPTINITDRLSLNTWLELRKLSVDYGRKFFKRHELLMPVLFFLGILEYIAFFVLMVISTTGATNRVI